MRGFRKNPNASYKELCLVTGSKIKHLRTEKGLTRKQFSSMCNEAISETALVHIEAGDHVLDCAILETIGKVLGCHVTISLVTPEEYDAHLPLKDLVKKEARKS